MDHHDRELNGSYTVAHRLAPRHFELLDLSLQGLNGKQISAATGLSYRQVMNLLNSPNFQHQLALRRAKLETTCDEGLLRNANAVQEIIKTQTLSAVNRLVNLLDSDNDSVARQAANDILDRGGYPKVTKTDNTLHQSVLIDEATALLLEQTLREISPTNTTPPSETQKPEGENP